MKKPVKEILVLLFIFISTTGFGGKIGAPEPIAKAGKVSLGIGSYYSKNKWEPRAEKEFFQTKKIETHQIYLELSVEGNRTESYFRVGGANLRVKDRFQTGISLNDPTVVGFESKFKDGYRLFGTVGVKGAIDISDNLALGPFVQLTMAADDYEDTSAGTVAGNSHTQKFIYKRPWEVDVGLMLQYADRGFVVYGGPMLYWGRSKVEYLTTSAALSPGPLSLEAKHRIKGPFGGVAGVRIPVVPGLNLEIEGQYTNQLSGGAGISWSF